MQLIYITHSFFMNFIHANDIHNTFNFVMSFIKFVINNFVMNFIYASDILIMHNFVMNIMYTVDTNNIHNFVMSFIYSVAEADLGLVKLVVMSNVFFNYHQHEIETEKFSFVQQIKSGFFSNL